MNDKFLGKKEAVLEIALHNVFERPAIRTHRPEEDRSALSVGANSKPREHIGVVLDVSSIFKQSFRPSSMIVEENAKWMTLSKTLFN